MPTIPGLTEAQPWDNRSATTATTVPESMLIVGAGVVGVELAQAYQSLGCAVTLIEPGPRLLGREEPFAASHVEASLARDGVDIRLNARMVAVRRDSGTVVATLADNGEVHAAEITIAAGRRANTVVMGLASIGLRDGDPLSTDVHLRVLGAPDWLYAVGDVTGRAQMTHQGKYHARIAADHILGRFNPSLVYGGPLSPRVVFTRPQIAAVGHTLASAHKAGIEARAVDADMNSTAGASFVGGNEPGAARIVIDENRRTLVGATFTGADVAEQLHAATVAIVGDVSIDRLWHAVPSFPTRSAIWLKLLENYGL
jgi:dihydrolipoamide dehydrogenase